MPLDEGRDTYDIHFPNIIRDRYGFTLVNLNHMDEKMHVDSFVFLLHCQRIFYSDDPHRHGWKVVCRMEVQGRPRQIQFPLVTPPIIQIGSNKDFVGL